MLTSPLPQDPNYHLFADSREILGIPNGWNVLSNLAFLLTGVRGIVLLSHRQTCAPELKAAYVVFFVGILLTAFGSGWYHIAPTNESLVPDRLPMTIGFAGLFSIVIGEFISKTVARRVLLPLLVIGIASVAYWAVTEARGVGDLRPYAVVQFVPMLIIVFILATRGSASHLRGYFWLMMVFYVLAKLAEHFDAAVFAAGGIVSGHTLKHLLAAMTPAILIVALARQRDAGLTVSARQPRASL